MNTANKKITSKRILWRSSDIRAQRSSMRLIPLPIKFSGIALVGLVKAWRRRGHFKSKVTMFIPNCILFFLLHSIWCQTFLTNCLAHSVQKLWMLLLVLDFSSFLVWIISTDIKFDLITWWTNMLALELVFYQWYTYRFVFWSFMLSLMKG